VSEDNAVAGEPGADHIAEALQSFRAVRNPMLQWAVDILPLGITAFVVVDALVTEEYVTGNLMFLTGLAAAALAAFMFRALLEQVPDTLGSLWARNVIKARSRAEIEQRDGTFLFDALFAWLPEPRVSWWRRRATKAGSRDGAETGGLYRAFITDFEGWLNHRLSRAVGLFFATIMYVSFPFRIGQDWTFNWMGWMVRHAGWVPLLGSLTQVAVAYVMGLLVWRMIVIAGKVYQLGRAFDLDIQVQHPDRSGGLKPLGDLCFSNALIITVPGIFLAGWIIAISHFGWEGYALWAPFYQRLLLVIFILALLAFFQPLYGVHRAMVRKRAEIRQRLDELARRIDELAKKLLEEADTLEAEQSQELTRNLAILRQVYENSSAIPVWPFDKNIVLKFITSQTIPVLSLTGIGPSALKLLEALLKFIQP